MNQKDRMLKGLPYLSSDPQLVELREACREKLYELNHLVPSKRTQIPKLLSNLFNQIGEESWIEPPFHCDYGFNINIGHHFFANYNLVILDVGQITIGNNVLFGPNVSLLAATHPLHPTSRNTQFESGSPITIGDNCWIGGNVVINNGVTIGENCVIGSGSILTKDIPANSLAYGNPCRVIREITQEDKEFYDKNKKFDEEVLCLIK